MKDRIRQLMEMDGLNAAEFSKKVKINSSVVSNILNAKNQPSFDAVQKIIDAYPEVNVTWLMTGRGAMLASDETTSSPDENTEQEQVTLFSSIENEEKSAPKPLAQASENAKFRNTSRSGGVYAKENKEKKSETAPSAAPRIKKIIVIYDNNSFEEFCLQ